MTRVDLSADTRIETMDGVRYLVTEELTISIDWPERYVEGACTNPSDGDWFEMGLDEDWGASVIWRIPLTDVAPVYEYREGESSISFGQHHHLVFCLCLTKTPKRPDTCFLHRRAALVCDTAEQFRAFYDAIKPEKA